jgi:LCP family protein required for cell wall assembly
LRVGCIIPALIVGAMLACLAVYLLAPGSTRILLLGIDYTDPALPEEATARSDTIMMVNIEPVGIGKPRPASAPLVSILRPYVGVLSVPRDLWVVIPGVGENRINTAHFYAESQVPGSGPAALQQTIALNFGLQLPYYLRIRFDGFRLVVDALGGVDVTLDEPMAGYEPGRYHLTGRKALAFVRYRADSDDFQRMSHGQFMLKALFKNLLNPLKWPRLPAVWKAFKESVDTNIPAWMWPRLAMTLLRAGPHGIDNRVIDRTMVEDFMTNEGAMVLKPNWPAINTVIEEMFGK